MIYLDEVFILNFIIDYILLSTLEYLLKIFTTRFRKILTCLIGEISILFLLFNINAFIIALFKIMLLGLMIITCFGFNDYKSFIKNIMYFYLLNFFLGGSLFYFKQEGLIKFRIVLLFIPFIMNCFKKMLYNLKNIISFRHKVTVYLNNGEVLYLNGFMDTGNSLIEPYTNRKVILINKKVNESFYLVPYKTVGEYSLLKCFNPKKVYIDGLGERSDISVGVIDKKFNGFNCLLNFRLVEGK